MKTYIILILLFMGSFIGGIITFNDYYYETSNTDFGHDQKQKINEFNELYYSGQLDNYNKDMMNNNTNIIYNKYELIQ